MNPINDEMPTKVSIDKQKPLDLDKSSTELSNISNENFEKIKTAENTVANDKSENEEQIINNVDQIEKTTEIDENVNIQENKDKAFDELKTNSENFNTTKEQQSSEDDEKEKDVSQEDISKTENSKEQTDAILKDDDDDDDDEDEVGDDDLKINSENQNATEDSNDTACDANKPVLDEEFEDVDEEVEDVEIPGEEEVDEIIVPDGAEAEDLTDDKDNEEEDETDNKSLHRHVEDEEGPSRDSETEEENQIDSPFHEEETTKSSETMEKDEEYSDKKSLSNDVQEDISSKGSEDGDVETSPIDCEPELENTNDEENPLEEPKSNEPALNEEDTASQATYDPLNCTDNKEQEQNDNEETDNGKNVVNENSENEVTNDEEDEEKDAAANLNNAINEDCEKEINNDKEDKDEDEEDEDDEVQFVETRNSPICIEESDEDDNNATSTTTVSASNNSNDNKNESENNKQIITTATAAVAVPKNLIVTRTSARKSTAKPQQNRETGNSSPALRSQMQNKTNKSDFVQKASILNNRSFTGISTQRIVDCIELLDSSDDESPAAAKRSTQLQKTPQKRTLLAAKGNYYKNNNNNNKPPNNDTNRLPNNFPPHVRQQLKKPEPLPLPPPTPQSNFLNAVQLQPASVSGSNPPAFSALLSNKSVIIPNAFYGNPPSVRITPEMEQERRYARWLDNFLNQFCKSQFVATHSCLVFLQRALKYKDFVRIKALRANMNSHVQNNANSQINSQLMADLRTIFLKNSKKITNYGRRFCEMTCSATPGKAVALMAHAISGKVTLKTCSMDLPKSTNVASSSTTTSTSSSSNSCTNSVTRKRQLDEDEDDEYTPDNSKLKTKTKQPSENGDEDSGEMGGGDDRKRSLRTKRTKRLDNSFSYNEDDLLAEYEIDDEDDEKLAQVEIQRKIEQKRLEAQQQRQQQVKSFESAFIQAFARSIDGPTTSAKTAKNATIQRVRLKNTTTATVTSIKQYTAHNDAEDLLQATWIENLENDETQIISDDDEPKEHRIYKQQQQQQERQQQEQEQEFYLPSTKLTNKYNKITRASKRSQDEIITGDDNYDENNYHATNPSNVNALYWPKNTDPQMYVNGKNKDKCVICNLNCQRLVHHYVNEHRGCEVYNSRLSPSQIKLLKQGSCTVSNISLYKNGQFQYEAFCIFCQKNSRFMLPYWHQHFTMHTGEYAYRCLGCGIRKPTRSLLTQHQAQGCPQVGSNVAQDFSYDSKSLQIEAKICSICNYVQLHRSNIAKHLHTQHNIKQILPKHIQTIVLLKAPPTALPAISSSLSQQNSSATFPVAGAIRHFNSQPPSSSSSSSYASNTYVIDEEDNAFTCEEIVPEESQPPTTNTENHYYNYIPPYMQAAVNSGNFTFENVEAGEDISFMICGMLDVQMDTEAN